jgi:hypothetical protein
VLATDPFEQTTWLASSSWARRVLKISDVHESFCGGAKRRRGQATPQGSVGRAESPGLMLEAIPSSGTKSLESQPTEPTGHVGESICLQTG